MKVGKPLPPPSKNDKRILAVSIIIFFAAVIVSVVVIVNRTSPPAPDNIGGPLVTLQEGANPLSATIVSQLTAMPNAEPLSGPLADEVHAIAQMVSNCNDYSEARRAQMNQHIAWLLQPATLPKDVTIALNSNINGGLILGMGTFTLSEWGLRAKALDSCLLPIGKKLNEMLIANGETPIPQFDVPAG